MRAAEVTRNTSETQIRVSLNLDGTGRQKLASGVLGFVFLIAVTLAAGDPVALAESGTPIADVRVLSVTTFGRPGYLRRGVQAGAAGFVVKDTPARELADAIRRVHAGLREGEFAGREGSPICIGLRRWMAL